MTRLQSTLESFTGGMQCFLRAHSRSSSNFKLSSESWGVLQTLLPRIDHTEKSTSFKSGLLEGCSSLLMKAGMWASIQLWLILEPCDGAESCWRVHGAPSKCLVCPGNQFSFQNVRNVTLAFQFHSWGCKNEWRSSSGCDCHPRHHTESGFWFWLTLLLYTNPSLLQMLLFWWFWHCWTSNFFSSVNTQ